MVKVLGGGNLRSGAGGEHGCRAVRGEKKRLYKTNRRATNARAVKVRR